MFYHLHFDEDNYPCEDVELTHDILIKSDMKFDCQILCDEINNLKSQMDDWELGQTEEQIEAGEGNPLAEQFGDLGWHEKIDEALKLVIAKYPEISIEVVDVETFNYLIN